MIQNIKQWVLNRWRMGAGLLVVVVGAALMLSLSSTRSFLNSNQGAASAALTFMLVVLYFGQYQLQGRQVSLENRPHLVVEEYDENGNTIEANLSNLGNGVATEIELKTTIDFDGGGPFAAGAARSRMSKVGDGGDERRRVGNALQVGKTHERFVGDAVTGLVVDSEEDAWGLRAATGRLAKEDVETVTLDFSIVNSDLLGNEYEQTVYGSPYKVELEGTGVDVEEVILSGRPVGFDWEDV